MTTFERGLRGEEALLYAEKNGRDVVLDEVLVTSPARARAAAAQLVEQERARFIRAIRLHTAAAEAAKVDLPGRA